MRELGAERCAAIGNGVNDALMLAAADVVCGSILVALDLLREPRALAATLRP